MSSFQPTPKALIEAILSNSNTMVEKYLDAGVDPNADLSSDIPLTDHAGAKECKLALSTKQQSGHFPTALHIAVINCYHNFAKGRSNRHQEARLIIHTLLKYGADPSVTTTNLVLVNIAGYRFKSFKSLNKTPSGLALFLKQFPDSVYGEETESVLDQAIETLEYATKTLQPPYTRILKSTADMYEKLFLSEVCSDIRFVCSDGVELPAHRCILVAASDYFKRSLEGPWSENNKDGKWTTAHSSKIMKGVLAFIYQGRIQNDLLDLEPLELFAVAAEYDIPSLKTMAENRCIQSLKCENIKTMLQAAHLHRNQPLKTACFSFIRNKAARVLTDPDMMNLATEDAELWGELTEAIAPSSSGPDKKRARTS